MSWTEQTEKKTAASALDGTYLLKADRQDLAAHEVWHLYIVLLLTHIEAAFLLGHAPRTALDPPSRDRGAADDRRPHPEDPQGVHVVAPGPASATTEILVMIEALSKANTMAPQKSRHFPRIVAFSSDEHLAAWH